MDACYQSVLRKGNIQEADPVAPFVLANGQIGIFLGTDDICAKLNLPVAARTGLCTNLHPLLTQVIVGGMTPG